MTHHQPAGLSLTPFLLQIGQGGPSERRVAAEWGRLAVPERRDIPSCQLIDLAFVRLRSTAEQPGPPLVYLAGGPGMSGIAALSDPALADWFSSLREAGDVIALDQRGSGQSRPCLDSPLRWDLPLDQPGDRAATLAVARERAAATAAFWRGQGVDLRGYSTVENADDLEALRAALGYEQISLYGASYGSHMALATIRRHPASVARAIIPMVEGPDHTVKLPLNVQALLARLDALAADDPGLRREVPSLLGLMHEVIGRLADQPVTAEARERPGGPAATIHLGAFDLQKLTAIGVGSRNFLSKLPARYHAMARGDYSWLAGMTLRRRREWFDSAMLWMMDCASGASPERLAAIRAQVDSTLLGDLVDFPLPDACDAWGSPDLGEGFRGPLSSDVPALFISGTLDGRTPPANADEVRAGFSRHHAIVVENASHSTADYANQHEVRAAMLAFLRGQPVATERAKLPFAFAPLEGSQG